MNEWGEPCLEEMPIEEKERKWPKLRSDSYEIKSRCTIEYNCVAWVIGETAKWIDAYDDNPNWPRDLDRTQTIQNYADFFQRYGFEICSDGTFEVGIEKIAIYGDQLNLFTHVCLQLPSGGWTSKLGCLEDIEHATTQSLCGQFYGDVVICMRRERQR